MYIIIIGIDPASKKLIEKLSKKHDVVVIDTDKNKCEVEYTNTGVTVINDDATKLEVLQDAGITKANVLFSTLENDNKNIMISMIAKKFGVPKVVSRLENDEFKGVYKMLEVDTVEYNDVLFSEFYLSIEHPKIAKIVSITHEVELLELNVGERSKLKDLKVDEVKALKKFPSNIIFCSLIRKETVIAIKNNTRFMQADRVFIMCIETERKILTKIL